MRIFFFIIITLFALALPWWVATVAALYYAFRYPAYELIVLGMMVDVQFGDAFGAFGVPLIFTFSSVLLVVVAESVKPQLVFYR